MENDRAYVNADFIAGADGFPPRWSAEAAAFRAAIGDRARLGLDYGPGLRHRFDLFLPEADPRGVAVFVHGGYWMRFGREDWSHLAAGPMARGWAVAMPSYTLAPEARIGQITREVAAAVSAAAALVPGPVVVTGHSAGGHLSARMACADAPLGADVVRVVPISPLADLGPLLATTMNDSLHLDPVQVAAESPARLERRPGCEVTVWVGGQERPAFLWQARVLSEDWACAWHVEPGRHHFDVIDDLARPESALVETLVGGL